MSNIKPGTMSLVDCVAESNCIEGILRPPTLAELEAHREFVDAPFVTIDGLIEFVKVYQPDAKIRSVVGLNVRVGRHVPPPGGLNIRPSLERLIDNANNDADPWQTHLAYETLHPFTDGNGRSGRALWYWQMAQRDGAPLGFLHHFYYQTLQGAAP